MVRYGIVFSGKEKKQLIGHESRRTDTDPNGYRDFFAKLVKKIPVSVESVRFSCSMSLPVVDDLIQIARNNLFKGMNSVDY